MCVTIAGCRHNDYRQAQGGIWNTLWHSTYNGSASLADSIPAMLTEVGKSLNVFDTTSVVSQVNRKDTTEVTRDFILVYTEAKRISRLSGGMFDPTLGPLIRIWGFGPGHEVSSDTAAIDSLKRLVGIGKTRVEGGLLIKEHPGIEFNFSAIAKGFGCDRVAEMFGRNGVKDYMIEIGGEIACGGLSPGGEKWHISIDRPITDASGTSHDSQCIIAITDCGMATSGNYRNFRQENGRRIGHTVSPITGRPVATDLLSATVIAPSSMEADGWATAFMALGSRESIKIARELKLAVMLILEDSTELSTTEFDRLRIGEARPR